MIYILRFGQWIKVGWTDCWPRRAARGFWHNVHPTTEEFGELGLCKRLDDYEVLHIFDGGTKVYEEKLNKSMPWVGEFHLEVFSLPWVLEALRLRLEVWEAMMKQAVRARRERRRSTVARARSSQ